MPGTQEARTFRAQRTVGTGFGYQLFVPKDYGADAARRWPLLVFLHGAGERGTDLDRVTVHGPPQRVKGQPDFPFVLVSPQCPEGAFWSVEELDLLLDHLLAELAVDPQRVCLTGLSMGGNGSWAWATARPERFAAVAPICGWGDPVRVWLASEPRKSQLARLPVWAFHGAKDNVIPLADSERMVSAFGRIGNQVRLTVYPEAGHDSWTEAYRDPALYEWLLAQRRP